MALKLLWILLTVVPSAFFASSIEERESVYHIPEKYSYGSIWWHPYYSLKEYISFQDAKVYVLNVPEYVKNMRLVFFYQGMYQHSHKPCNNSIVVLLQHGSPAIPYKHEIDTDGWLYNNTNDYETTVSLYQDQCKNISSPLPGKWYVTAFLPFVQKDKKIREKGLSKTAEKCLSALSVKQVLVSPMRPPVVLAQAKPWKSAATRSPTTMYFKYFVPSYSEQLRIHLKNSCYDFYNCFLKVSVSAKALPTITSLSCIAPCELNITWPQPQTYYYVEVSGTSETYEVQANHTECFPKLGTICTKINSMVSLDRKRLTNNWNYYLFNETTATFSLQLEPDYVGTTLTLLLRPYHPSITAVYKMCITKDVVPFDGISKKHCSEKSDGSVLHMDVLYPQSGMWYTSIEIQSLDKFSMSAFVFHAKTEACPSSCEKHGYCVISSHIGVSYGSCVCDYGYGGFTCSSYHGLDTLAVYLLTISNIAFLPGIIVACLRKFYPEAIVYLFNMYCSTVYHLCDSHGYCLYDYNTLQLSDFFASVLSVWFTLVMMIKLPSLWLRTLNILAVLGLFIGVQLSRFGFLIVAIPGGVALLLVLISFGCRSYHRQICYPNPKRWLFFLLPGCILSSTAVGIYAGLETTANYKYLHSIWHIAIALCIPMFLPSVRKRKLYVDYNMVVQNNENDETFRNSDDSLILAVRNTPDREHNDSELQGGALPQLINSYNERFQVNSEDHAP